LRRARLVGVGQVKDGVTVLDALEWLQNRIRRVAESVGDHPLNLADPNRHASKLGGVVVQLDAVDDPRADTGKLVCRFQSLAAPQDRFLLQVLHELKGDVEKVARTTGGVEHGELAESVEECAMKRNRGVPGF